MKQKFISILNIFITIFSVTAVTLGVLEIRFNGEVLFDYLFSGAIILTVICSIVMAAVIKKKSYAILVAVVGVVLIISTITNLIIPDSQSLPVKLIGDIGILALLITNSKSEEK